MDLEVLCFAQCPPGNYCNLKKKIVELMLQLMPFNN